MGTDTLVLATALTPLVLFLASFLKSANFATGVNAAIAIILSVVVSVASLLVTGEVQTLDDVDTLDEIIPLAGMVFALSQIVYHTYFKTTETNAWLTRLIWGPRI